MTVRRRRNRPKAERRLPGVLVVAGWLVLLLAALSLVTWRQTRGVEMERALRKLETARAIAEAERVTAVRRVEELQSRARVLAVARGRLGMHLPDENEIVFLPLAGSRADSQPLPHPDPLPGGEGERLASVPPLPVGEGRGEGGGSP